MATTGTNIVGPRVITAGDRPLEVRNPAHHHDVVATFPHSTAEDVEEAVASAVGAFKDWRSVPQLARGQVLMRGADIISERSQAIASLITAESGKTIAEAQGEVRRSIDLLRYYAGEASQPSGDVLPSAEAGRLLYNTEEPLGVVALVTPWNFPLAIPLWKLAPALAFGNTVVLKPSSEAPTSSWEAVRALREAGLPDGVMNFVTGSGSETGQALIAHPSVRGVSFTGSNAVGRHIESRVTERGGKVQLEMGGKNPTVVLDDAEPETAARIAVESAMRMAGQKCTASSRVIITRRGYKRVRDAIQGLVKDIRVGDPMDSRNFMGPVISEFRRDEILDQLRQGLNESGNLIAGGEALNGPEYSTGWYLQPTLVEDADPDSFLAQTELFGPILLLLRAENLDDAIEIANDVKYGLSASIVTNDLSAALRFVREVEAGVVKVNSESTGAEFQAPFGGMKESGSLFREQGKAARDFFTQSKTVYLDFAL